jgi:hypothetical protein
MVLAAYPTITEKEDFEFLIVEEMQPTSTEPKPEANEVTSTEDWTTVDSYNDSVAAKDDSSEVVEDSSKDTPTEDVTTMEDDNKSKKRGSPEPQPEDHPKAKKISMDGKKETIGPENIDIETPKGGSQDFKLNSDDVSDTAVVDETSGEE